MLMADLSGRWRMLETTKLSKMGLFQTRHINTTRRLTSNRMP
jgi:hypothetical protein